MTLTLSKFKILCCGTAAKSLQSCPTLCDPRDGNPPGSPVPGILQARTLEWVAISLSNAWRWKVKVKSLSHVWLFATPWTAAYQAPPSMGFSRQEYWSGVPSPSPCSLPESPKKLVQRFHFRLVACVSKVEREGCEDQFSQNPRHWGCLCGWRKCNYWQHWEL